MNDASMIATKIFVLIFLYSTFLLVFVDVHSECHVWLNYL